MKVLILTNKVPFPENDGSSIAMGSTIRALCSNGCAVHVLAINTKKHYKDPSNIPTELSSQLSLDAISVNTDITPFGIFKNLLDGQPYHISRFYNEGYLSKLKQIIQKENPDHIIFEGLFLAPYLDEVRLISKAKCLLRAHNVEHQIWSRHAELEVNPLKKYYLKLQVKRLSDYEHTISKEFDGILPITKVDLKFFEAIANHLRLHMLYSGIDEERYPFYAKNSQDLFFIGAMDWSPNEKGLYWFLESVWPLVLKKNPKARFFLAGRKMPAWVEAYQGKNVIVLGEVEDAGQVYKDYGIQIVPILSGSGLRIKIVEGLAYGKTIISTPIGAEGVYATEKEGLFLADSAEAFANTIIHVQENHESLIETGELARKAAIKQFSNKSLGKELVSFLESIK